jgi:Family of unknown function (DUF5641)
MASRATHIELAHSLTTDSAIMAINRFRARRGAVLEMFSDNGTNLRGAAEELKKSVRKLNANQIQQTCAMKEMKWHFNPPAAPHFGGCWERLIKPVKTAMLHILRERAPKEETLLTFLTEVEFLLNSRPLTFVSTDPNDPESITPNHLLLGKRELVLSPGASIADPDQLKRQWRIAQHWTNEFWTRWLKEYVPSLQIRSKWVKSDADIRVGDIVRIADEGFSRGRWPMGRVTKVSPGADGIVRVAEVRTAHGSLKRPVTKLAKINL